MKFDQILFMGQGDRSGAKCYKLVGMLIKDLDILSALQQPGHPSSREEYREELRGRRRLTVELNMIAESIYNSLGRGQYK